MQVLLRRTHVLELLQQSRKVSEEDSDEEEQASLPNASPMMQLLYERLKALLSGDRLLVFMRCLHGKEWDSDVAAVVCSLLAQLLSMPVVAKTR